MQNLTHLVGLTEKDLRNKAISDGVQHILECLDENTPFDSPDIEAGWEPQDLLTSLTEYDPFFHLASVSANPILVTRSLRSGSSNAGSPGSTAK